MTQVLVRRAEVLGRLTLNRPQALNALDPGMIRALAAALDDWEHDHQVRAVLLDGAGTLAIGAPDRRVLSPSAGPTGCSYREIRPDRPG